MQKGLQLQWVQWCLPAILAFLGLLTEDNQENLGNMTTCPNPSLRWVTLHDVTSCDNKADAEPSPSIPKGFSVTSACSSGGLAASPCTDHHPWVYNFSPVPWAIHSTWQEEGT